MSIKGYSSQKKILDQQHVTLQPINAERDAVDVVTHNAVTLVTADAVEADSTKRVINATAHVVKRGYVILMTSGVTSGEYASVGAVTANTISLGQELTAVPGAGDTFEIYRYVLNSVTSSGSITIVPGSRVTVDLVRNDYTVTPVTTGAYVELLAAASAAITQIFLFDSSGETMILAVGGVGSEVDKLYIFPGGFSGPVDLAIASGARVSAKALSANASVGEITINFLG